MTPEEDMQSNVDELEDDLDLSQDLQDYQTESYENPSIPNVGSKQEGMYEWFWKIVNLNKPGKVTRVGNLSHAEIGGTNVTVREALRLSLRFCSFSTKRRNSSPQTRQDRQQDAAGR